MGGYPATFPMRGRRKMSSLSSPVGPYVLQAIRESPATLGRLCGSDIPVPLCSQSDDVQLKSSQAQAQRQPTYHSSLLDVARCRVMFVFRSAQPRRSRALQSGTHKGSGSVSDFCNVSLPGKIAVSGRRCLEDSECRVDISIGRRMFSIVFVCGSQCRLVPSCTSSMRD